MLPLSKTFNKEFGKNARFCILWRKYVEGINVYWRYVVYDGDKCICRKERLKYRPNINRIIKKYQF